MRTTQTMRVLKHLQDYGSITRFEALNEYGIVQLPTRIFELKEDGVRIISENVKCTNKFGEPTHYTKYVYMGEQ